MVRVVCTPAASTSMLWRANFGGYEDWVRQWIKAPRDFRPDTRMPHYYLQPNNTPDAALKDTAEATRIDQTRFPDAEAHSIAYYLMQTSRGLLKEIGERCTKSCES